MVTTEIHIHSIVYTKINQYAKVEKEKKSALKIQREMSFVFAQPHIYTECAHICVTTVRVH